MPDWVRVGGKPVRPWVVLATSRSRDLALARQMPEETPSAALLGDVLVQAMQHPAAEAPHRPTELQVRPDERWEALRPHLGEIGLGLAEMDERRWAAPAGGLPGPALMAQGPFITSGIEFTSGTNSRQPKRRT
jgi:hypothetical protein